jgi:predicted lipoprotein with Yx(FWY)xxD motif
MRKYAIGGLLAGLALLTTACGSDAAPTAAAPATPAAKAAAPAGQNVAVKLGDSELGKILVGPDGRALYGFTNDLNGQSTCFGTCADAWPPVVVNPDWIVGPNLDSGVFSTVARKDGTTQLVAGKWPLYYFSGDATAADLKGQGSGDVWFAVAPDAKLIKTPLTGGQSANGAGAEAAPQQAAAVSLGKTKLGNVLVDSEGRTLYAFTKDAQGRPTCTGACADAWPPLLVEGELTLGKGLDKATFTVVDGAASGQQAKAGKWPLYRFAGDAKAGDVNGQGSGGVWFAVAPDGSLIE